MEPTEIQLLNDLCNIHPDLKALRDDHILYEKQIEKLEKKPFNTPVEEQELKELKKLKLDGKTKLVALLKMYATKEG